MTLLTFITFALAALVGASYLGYVYRTLRRPVLLGALIGAGAAIAGGLAFMLPLQFCTFEPERAALDAAVGMTLIAVGVALALMPTAWFSRLAFARGKDREALGGERTQGAFNTSLLVPAALLAPTLIILALFLYYPALDLFRLSTLLARLNTPRTAFRCVDNFTQLMNPQLSLLTVGLLLAAVVIFAVLLYWRRTGQNVFNDWVPRLTNLRTFVLLGLLLSITLDLLSANYRTFVYNTFFIAGWTVILGLIFGLAIALLAFQPVKGAAIYRTLLIWPYAISPAVAGIIFFVMFNQTSGIINHVIGLFGLTGPDWFKDPWLARWTIIIASVWKTLGYNILFYIAGLQNVPKEHIEAAAIDGANAWQRFWHVMLPSLSPITFFLIITNITFAFFETFGTIDFLTRGGPAGASTVMIYEVYTLGIIEQDLGRAAAQSIVLFLMVIGITVFQFRTTGRQVNYGA